MKFRNLLGLLLGCLLLTMTSSLEAAEIKGVRYQVDDNYLRLVVDIEGDIGKVTQEINPSKTELIFFIPGEIKVELPTLMDLGGYAKSVEVFKQPDGVELKITLKEPTNWRTMTLKNPSRFVVDIDEPARVERSEKLTKGIEYQYYKFPLGSSSVRVHVVQIEPGAADIVPILAWDKMGNLEVVSSMTKRYNAIAGVNGGYFSWAGQYLGNLKINGEWVTGDPQERTAWGFTKEGKNVVGTLGYRGKFSVDTIPDWSLKINGINIPRGENQAVLYNSRQGTKTKTNQWGLELGISRGQIVERKSENSLINRGDWVLSAHGQEKDMISYLVPGDKVTVEHLVDSKWDQASHIIGAGPRLIENGKVNVTSKQEAFPSDISVGRAPRTAIGEMKDGTVWLIVVDGRSWQSAGMSLPELANFLNKMGIYNAMNLDGGGSSEMVVNQKIKNKPSDGAERSVGSSIIIVPRKSSR